jgi:hypothetical protein
MKNEQNLGRICPMCYEAVGPNLSVFFCDKHEMEIFPQLHRNDDHKKIDGD